LGRENPEVAVDEIAKGDSLVTLDVGAILDGYASDCRRYAYLGNPPTEVVELHEAMIEAVETVARALQPGTPYSELYGIAKDFMIKSDITGHEWLSHVGHSIGLETEEDWLDNRNDRYLHEGMVVAVELYTITSQLQPIGNEETYLIGADGPQRLTRLPAELRCIA
jgi:Xaa-Pro aminopeptidase